MSQSNVRDELASLEALLSTDSGSNEAALEQLEGLAGAVAFRRRLALLLKVGRVDEAAAAVESRSGDSEWIEIGIRVAVRAGQWSVAERLLVEGVALPDPAGSLARRCNVSFADAVLMAHAGDQRREPWRRSIYAVDPNLRSEIEKIPQRLLPYYGTTFDELLTPTPLDREALTLLVLSLALVGRGQETEGFLRGLVRTGLVHPQIGRFVCDGRLPAVSGLAAALDTSSDSIAPRCFAIMLAYGVSADSRRAFGDLLALVSEAQGPDERAMLFSMLSDIAQRGSSSLLSELEVARRSLLDMAEPIHRAVAAAHAADLGRFAEAAGIVDCEDNPNIPLVLRVRAQCAMHGGRSGEAVSLAVRAATTFLDPEWLLEAAELAHVQGADDAAIECFTTIRSYYPWMYVARRNLAVLYWQREQYDLAVAELEALAGIKAADPGLCLMQARGYLLVNRPQDALAILENLASIEQPAIDVILLLATTRQQAGDARAGFETLEAHRTAFWGEKAFLFAYMELAYRSQHERAASEALAAIREMADRGEIDSRAFRTVSMDELVAMGSEFRERMKKLGELTLQGRIPWSTAAEVRNHALLWEWHLRTQYVRWFPENQTARAELTIYSTNGFTVSQETAGHSELVPFDANPLVDVVCVDGTALATLQKLRLLELLPTLFAGVVLPAAYRRTIVGDLQRLQSRQLSRVEGLRAVKRLVDSGLFVELDGDDPGDLGIVDEYGSEQRHEGLRGLAAIADLLVAAGRVTDAGDRRFREVIHETEPPNLSNLVVGQPLVVRLSTLLTLYSVEMLQVVASTIAVRVFARDVRELRESLTAYDMEEGAVREMRELWASLERLPNVQFVPTPSGSSLGDEEDGGSSLASVAIAAAQEIPLLADDRALQTVVANSRATPDAAFGTDGLLRLLWKKQSISIAVYADSALQLVRWRYRFLALEPEVLLEYARRYSADAPGVELRDLARYIHDCMRDPGLFGGLENTKPPTSMGLTLFMRWMSILGDFLALVWTDAQLADRRVAAITDWVLRAMVPGVPRVISSIHDGRLIEQSGEFLVVNALLRAALLAPHARTAGMLRHTAEILGISERRFGALIADVTRIERSDSAPEAAMALASRYLETALGQGNGTPWHVAAKLANIGLFEFEECLTPEQESIVAAVEAALQEAEPPLFLLLPGQEEGERHLIEVSDVLAQPSMERARRIVPSFARLVRRLVHAPTTLGMATSCLAAVENGDLNEVMACASKLDDALLLDWDWQVAVLTDAVRLGNSGLVSRQLERLLRFSILQKPVDERLSTGARAALDWAARSRRGELPASDSEISEMLDCMGHLPWRSSVGLAALLARDGLTPEEAQKVWELAEAYLGEDRPAWWQHIWMAAMLNPGSVPEKLWPLLWQRIHLLLRRTAWEEDDEHLTTARYRKLLDLYAYRLEALLPNLQPDYLVWAASFLANDVAAGLRAAPRGAADRQISAALDEARFVWRAISPSFRYSRLRAAFQVFRSHWPAAVQASVASWAAIQLHPPVPPEASGDLVETVRDLLLMGVDTGRTSAADVSDLVEDDLTRIREEWREVVPETADWIDAPDTFLGTARSVDDIRGRFADLAAEEEESRWGVIVQWASMVECGDIDVAEAIKSVVDGQWRKTVEPTLRREQLDRLVQAFLRAEWKGSETAAVESAHWAAVSCLENLDNDERRAFYFMCAVLFSLRGDTVSALSRLAVEDRDNRLVQDRTRFRSMLSGMLGVSPPWARGRLRAAIAELTD